MNTCRTLLLALPVALGLAAVHPAAAQTSTIALQNGSFDGGPNNNAGNGISNFTDTQTYGYADGSHGGQSGGNSLYINGGTVYQFLGTTGAIGEVLTLNGKVYGQVNRAGVEFATAAPTVSNELATGSVLASENLTDLTTGTDTAFAPLTFTTTVANQGIYLLIVGPDTAASGQQYGPQINYDNFTLSDVPATSAAVPEASTTVSLGLLLTLGLGGVAVARKRRSAAA